MNEEKQIPISDDNEANVESEAELTEMAVDADPEPEAQALPESETVEVLESDVEEPDAEDKIQELEQKLHALQDRLLRTAAELDNVRKRSRREIDDAAVMGRSQVLREILPVMDSIDLALSSADPEGTAAAIVEGVEMVRKQFMSATERFDLKAVESVGGAFDPNFHEAVAHLPSPDHEAGKIVEEVRKGYLLGDRLLRAAMVVVSAGAPQPKDDPPAEPPGDKREESEVRETGANVDGTPEASSADASGSDGDDAENDSKEEKTATLGDGDGK